MILRKKIVVLNTIPNQKHISIGHARYQAINLIAGKLKRITMTTTCASYSSVTLSVGQHSNKYHMKNFNKNLGEPLWTLYLCTMINTLN